MLFGHQPSIGHLLYPAGLLLTARAHAPSLFSHIHVYMQYSRGHESGTLWLVPSATKYALGKTNAIKIERDSLTEAFNTEWHATWKTPNPSAAS